MRRPILLAIAALLLAAGCGDGGGARGGAPGPSTGAPPAASGATTTAPVGTGPPPATSAPTTGEEPPAVVTAPEAGAALTAFVEAAGRGDVEGMWALFSGPTQDRLGPTRSDFEKRVAHDFEEGVGSFAGTSYELVVAAEAGTGWAVAAIAGPRVAEGMPENGAYAVALRAEAGGWRLELGGPVVLTPQIPGTGIVPAERPELAVDVEVSAAPDALLWLDGVPLPGSALFGGLEGSPVSGTFSGRFPGTLAAGPHTVVAFGRAGDEATAVAWVVWVGEDGS